MPAPTPGTGQQTTWVGRTASANFAPAAISVTIGDIIVAYATTEDANYSATVADSQINSYTLRQDVNVSAFARVQIWTAVAGSTGSVTVTFTRDATVATKWCGGAIRGWSNHGGVGVSQKTNVTSGAPTLNITPSANSALVVVNADWTAVDGASRTWRTTAGALTEATYERDAAAGTSYSGNHFDSGASGVKDVGLSAPAAQKYSIVAVEILGIPTSPAILADYSRFPKFKLRRAA